MKRTLFFLKTFSLLSLAFATVAFVSCKSTKAAPPVVEEAPPVVEKAPEPEPAPEPPKPEPVVVKEPEPAPKVEEPAPEPEPPVDTEYLRSVGDVAVDHDTYTQDKEAVMRIIAELAIIMDDLDYNRWLTYVDNESKTYWSRRANLQKAEKKLPVKGLKLQTLQDYFKHVFVPARKGREVTEIRYVSDTYVKAVQVEEDKDIIFYYFNKIDGKWMLHQPPLED